MKFEMDSMKEFFYGLRTYRRFKQDKISDEVLTFVIDSARIASSGMNLQPLRYVVVRSAEKVAAMQPLVKFAAALPPELGTPKVGEQPVAFIVMTKNEKTASDIDAGIAADRIVTALWSQGIGSTIMGNVNRKEIATLLNIPNPETIALVFAIGKPDVESTVVELPSDGSVKYYLDEKKNYFVPKLDLKNICRFE